MPVSNDIFRVFEVDKSTPIARYLDYSKFLSLLYMESLFFCRLDKFEDKYEGKIPVFNLELRWNYWLLYNEQLRSQGKQELTSNEIQEKVSQQYAHDEKMRSNICVSCWNLFEKESAALWKIYSDSGKGILIKSTVTG